METLWRCSSGTAIEVTAVLNEHRPRPLSSKTILTCLTRLEVKSLVTHTKEGRGFRFSPSMTEEEMAARHIGTEMTEIIDRYGDLAVAVFVERIEENPNHRSLVRRLLEARDEGSGP
jgi:predicted transcriptional regulator